MPNVARPPVLAGLTAIREAAERFMDKRDLAGDGWSETAVTEVSVTEGRPHVQVVMFNPNQEGRGPNALGADYLWWWIDSTSGECFGMLVQAKKLRLDRDSWRVDVGHREGGQLKTLLRTSRELQVPAVYSIYTGGLVYRASMPCGHQALEPGRLDFAPAAPGTTPGTGLNDGEPCIRCRRMAISMVTAYQLKDGWYDPEVTGETALTESVPLEDLGDPTSLRARSGTSAWNSSPTPSSSRSYSVPRTGRARSPRPSSDSYRPTGEASSARWRSSRSR